MRSYFVTMKHLPTRQKDETDKVLIFSSLINIQLQYISIISLQLSQYQYSIISEGNEACKINCSMKVTYNHIFVVTIKLLLIEFNNLLIDFHPA